MNLKQSEISMNQSYYEEVKSYLEREKEANWRLWSVTWLEGAQAGEKKLVDGVDIPEHFQTGVCKLGESLVFAEELWQAPVCVICGAGHVGIPMIRLASFAGFEVIVVEDRPSFADQARKAGADRVICDSFEHGLEQIPGGLQTYFVVMTRGHRYDEVCLTAILKKSYAYTGMMASRGRAARMRSLLLEQGFSKEKVEELRTPIGLSIHAKTPEEIAISVIAQMIEVKNSSGGGAFWDREILDAMIHKETEEPWILATIIRRSGSAPRDVGTKMLLTETGSSIGSIGGGCMEAEVSRAARLLQQGWKGSDRKAPVKIITADMSGTQAETAGMVCGGRIEVLLEVIE